MGSSGGTCYMRRERGREEKAKRKSRLTIRQHHRKFKPNALNATSAKRRLRTIDIHRVDNLLTSRRHGARRGRSIGTSRKGRSISRHFDFEVPFPRYEMEMKKSPVVSRFVHGLRKIGEDRAYPYRSPCRRLTRKNPRIVSIIRFQQMGLGISVHS